MNDLNDEFEPWLELLLKQAGFGGTKVVVTRGAKTLTGEQEHASAARSWRLPLTSMPGWTPETASSV
jgi:hypothetical protein